MTCEPFNCREALLRLTAGARPAPRTVFDRRIAVVAAFAAATNVPATLHALWTFVRGKRVRGWNALCAQANQHPAWPARWHRAHRAALVKGVRSVIADRGLAPVRLAAVIGGEQQDPGALARTIRNLSDVLGRSHVTTLCPDDAGVDADADADVDGAAIAGLTQASWDWLIVLRPGDTIDMMLPEVARMLAADTGGREAWFWDSFQGRAMVPIIKPDWDPVLDCSIDLLAGSLIVSRALYDRVFATRPGAALVSALGDAGRSAPEGPGHLPVVLGYADATTIRPTPLPGGLPADCPDVSIIMLTRDRSDLVIPLFAMLDRLDYPGRIEKIVVDNGSTEPALIDFLRAKDARGDLRWMRRPGPFNFATLNNAAVAQASGELLCLLNNDVEPLDSAWLSHMVHRAMDPAVGAVGAMLTYPDGKIQHAGVAIGLGNAAGHIQRGTDPGDPRLSNWHAMTRRIAAVTAACLVVRKAAFEDAGGFDDLQFPVAFNDVDLCLRLQAAGLHNVYETQSRLIHHESLSRGADTLPENSARFAAELAALRHTWNTDTFHDPYWSPLFSRTSERCLMIL